MRTVYSGLVDEKFIGQTVTLYGWVHRRRDHGGVIFIDLRDREGLVQVVCDPDRPEVFNTADKVRNEYCLKVVGLVRSRPEGTKNDDLISGAVEVLCQDLEVLNPSLTPPFSLDDDNISETARLTYRVLDLRRPVMQRNLRLRYKTAMAFRRFLDVGADGPLFRVHDSPQAHALRRPKGQCKQPEAEHGCAEHRKILSFHPLSLPAMSV